MIRWVLWGGRGFLNDGCKRGFNYQQKFGLVNVKFKWVKDTLLDTVVAGSRDLKAACVLVDKICSDPRSCLPVYHLSRRRGQLGLPQDLKVSTFIRKYPSIFDEFHVQDNGGTRVPWFRVTPEAQNLHEEELNVVEQYQTDLLDRLRKLLMLTKYRTLPLQTIDQLKWDLGLPYDYHNMLTTRYPELFALVTLPDDRVGLKLLFWDNGLAVSHLEKSATLQKKEGDNIKGSLAFPIGFTRGFGLKRKCADWLEEWQRLPYTSPYSDASHLDPRTDVSEKRIVGVFHELLHLTIHKKTERQNVSNLRKPLVLPQKFTKVFERHPGIFYISKKGDTQTVVLREAYERGKIIEKHPIADIRERYANLMAEGLLSRSKGFYKNSMVKYLEESQFNSLSDGEYGDSGCFSEEELEHNVLSEYESDDTA